MSLVQVLWVVKLVLLLHKKRPRLLARSPLCTSLVFRTGLIPKQKYQKYPWDELPKLESKLLGSPSTKLELNKEVKARLINRKSDGGSNFRVKILGELKTETSWTTRITGQIL